MNWLANCRVRISFASLTLRTLSDVEARNEYLKLRHQAYCLEHDYALPEIEKPSDFLDDLDRISHSFGIVDGEKLLAAARVVISDSINDLSVAPFLQDYTDRLEDFSQYAELSRLIVDPSFRRRGVAPILILTGIEIAARAGAEILFICIANNRMSLDSLSDLGFQILVEGIKYEDKKIRPPMDSAILMEALGTRNDEAFLDDVSLKRDTRLSNLSAEYSKGGDSHERSAITNPQDVD